MNNTERIAEIRERCAAATPGPWSIHQRNAKEYPCAVYGDPDGQWDGTEYTVVVTSTKQYNANFIAHAREDIPYLLTLNAEKDKEIQRLRDLLAERNVLLDKQDAELEQKTRELEQCNRNDYICAVLHYNKYGDRYTFALPSQWYELEFDSFEDYQKFQMQLVFLLGEAKKKWEVRRKSEAALSAEGVE